MVEEAALQGTEERDFAEAQEGAPATGPDTIEAGGEGSAEPAASLKNELEQVRGERDQLLDRLARLQAEFENSRRREAKERADTRDYAVQNAVEPFLSVMDNFQLALKSDGTAEQLRAGVDLRNEAALAALVQTLEVKFGPGHVYLGAEDVSESIRSAHVTQSSRFVADSPSVRRRLSAWQSYCQTLFCANEFLYVE